MASDWKQANESELQNVSLTSLANDLSIKVKAGDERIEKEVANVRTEYQEMASNHEQQARVIDKLMAQKRCIMQQLTREVKPHLKQY